MKMLNTIKVIQKINIAVRTNLYIYYFRRIPLIGQLLNPSAYNNDSLKGMLVPMAIILGELFNLLKKTAYLILVVAAPAFFIAQMKHISISAVDIWFYLLFILSGVFAPLQVSEVFKVTNNKVTCIKYLKIDAREYTHSWLLIRYVPFFVYFTIVIIGVTLFLGGSITDALLITVIILCLRMAGEAFHLWLYGKTGVILTRKSAINVMLIVIMLIASYGLTMLGYVLPVSKYLYNPVVIIAALICGGIGVYMLFIGDEKYRSDYVKITDTSFLLSNAVKQSQTHLVKQVEIKDKDLDTMALSEEFHSKYQGYNYLHAVFFKRHKRLILNAVYTRLTVVAIAFISVVIIRFVDSQLGIAISQNMTRWLPFLVFIMYFMSIGEKSCRVMFNNCDFSLLHYGFYRNRNTILNNFTIRLKILSKYSLIVPLAIILGTITFSAMCGTPWLTLDMLAFALTIIILSVFFVVHHLSMYYLSQPYTKELKIKNPFFRFMNWFIYMLCFACLQIKVAGMVFAGIVMAFTISYIAVALVAVYRFSPRTFRLK